MTEQGKTTEPWRVGVLFSQSGVTAAIERTQLNGTNLAITEINAEGGVLGRPLKPIALDPASNPKEARALARRLLIEDGVRVIFGCYMSSTRKAVLPVVEALRGLLFYPTLYEGFEYSKHCIYTGAAPNQTSLHFAKYLFTHYGKRFLLVGSNYVYPYESNRIMADLVVEAKGKVLNELYVPVDPAPGDFERVIREIRRHSPDVIFSTVVGAGTPMLHDAYRKAGFDPKRAPIASLTTNEAEIALMGPEAAAGHVVSAPFFEILPTPAARGFVAAYKAMFGADAPVTAGAEAAYFQVRMFARALALAGGDEPEALLSALRGAEFEAPQGRVRIDPENNHTHLWPRVGRVDDEGRFEIVWNPGLRVAPEPYALTPSLDAWSEAALQPADAGR